MISTLKYIFMLFKSILSTVFIILICQGNSVAQTHNENSKILQEIQDIKKEIINRSPKKEAEILRRIKNIEDKINTQKTSPESAIIGAIIAATIAAISAWIVVFIQFHLNSKQKNLELLFESLQWFKGGTQLRSIGIAVVESEWKKYTELQGRWAAILVNQAIYLLTKSQKKEKGHENLNLYRIMQLLIEENLINHPEISHIERKYLKQALKNYNSNPKQGLINLDNHELNKWKFYFDIKVTE